MFDTLRKRMVHATGMRVCSFEDLEHFDIDSTDSICLSDASSKGPGSIDLSELDNPVTLEDIARSKVRKIVRSIKKLEKLHINRKETKMPMLVFMDLIRDQQYSHVSMSQLSKFMKMCRMIPQNYYLHYYIFFLHYASYYHYIRATTDVIDEKMGRLHRNHLLCIKHQLKYLQHIIKESRLHDTATTT